MKLKSILSGLLISLGLSLVASPQADFDKANKAYTAGFYENAIKLYEQILAAEVAAPDIYYNLGNAYFKNEQIPQAILNFERALKLDPGNEDYQYNLKVANAKIVDKIDILPVLFYIRWWNSAKMLFSPDGWARLSVISFTLIFIIAALFLLSTRVNIRKMLFGIGILILLMNVGSGLIAWQSYQDALKQRSAIIFTPTLPVKSSPDDSSIDLFVIHEGLRVQILDKIGDWNEIKIANGSKGWVKSESLQAI